MLPAGTGSRLHRSDADGMWHFYDGSPLTVIELREGGHKETVLGRVLAAFPEAASIIEKLRGCGVILVTCV